MRKTILLLAISLTIISVAQAQKAKQDFPSIKSIVNYLASDELGGRYPGTKGDSLAAHYIVELFSEMGLKPMGQSYFQPFSIEVSQKLGENNFMTINNKKLRLNQDYVPVSFSGNGQLSAELVFVGYGVKYSDEKLSYNDYQSVDVKGKCVVAFKGLPAQLKDVFIGRHAELNKVEWAKEQGAVAIIFVSEFKEKEGYVLPVIRNIDFQTNIPALLLTYDTARNVFGKEFNINGFKSKKRVSLNVVIDKVYAHTRNIVAVKEGDDPNLKGEYVVVGAHYDHLGTGGENSGSRRPDTVAIHNGADDNASGIAVMLTIADRMRYTESPRSIIFIAFGAEERGLVGSKYFVEHPPVVMNKISAMFNFDMVGNLHSGELSVMGTGTSRESDSLARLHIPVSGLKVSLSPDGNGPSDHSSFYANKVPVFYITTGGNENYHLPSDKAETINYPGIDSVINYALPLIKDVVYFKNPLTYTEFTPAGGRPMGRVSMKVTLGLMPNVSDYSNTGLRVEMVTKGKPAQRAGIRKGDVIIAIDGNEIKNVQDYMVRLSQLKGTQPVIVKIRRAEEVMEIKVEF